MGLSFIELWKVMHPFKNNLRWNWTKCNFYYIAESVCRQDNANPGFWLATRVTLDFPCWSCKESSPFWPCNKSLIKQLRSCLVKMALCRTCAFFCFYWLRLETLQRTWLIYISWPHGWSVTHMSSQGWYYWMRVFLTIVVSNWLSLT